MVVSRLCLWFWANVHHVHDEHDEYGGPVGVGGGTRAWFRQSKERDKEK